MDKRLLKEYISRASRIYAQGLSFFIREDAKLFLSDFSGTENGLHKSAAKFLLAIAALEEFTELLNEQCLPALLRLDFADTDAGTDKDTDKDTTQRSQNQRLIKLSAALTRLSPSLYTAKQIISSALTSIKQHSALAFDHGHPPNKSSSFLSYLSSQIELFAAIVEPVPPSTDSDDTAPARLLSVGPNKLAIDLFFHVLFC